MPDDWIKTRVVERAQELDLSAAEIARRTGGVVNSDTLRLYLTTDHSLGSARLAAVLTVLRLTLTEIEEPPKEREMYLIIINENMHDAHARIVPENEAYPLDGWERVWGVHDSREAAEAALPAAREYARGRSLEGRGS